MATLDIREIGDGDADDVTALWERCGLTRPWNDPLSDIEFARKTATAAVLVGSLDDRLIATIMVGHDGHRGAVYYMGVDPDHQGKGFGRAIMEAAEEWLLARGVWKLNVMVRTDNTPVIEFYSSLGYGHQEVVTVGKWIDPSKKPASND